jgi:uncharacterized protein YjbI with pentapeptide repeats
VDEEEHPTRAAGGAAEDPETENEDAGESNATAAARRKAKELGIDLSQVEGTGAGGRIVFQDVKKTGQWRMVSLEGLVEREKRRIDAAEKAEKERQPARKPSHTLITELMPDRYPNRAQVLWAVRISILVVVALVILTLIGLPLGATLWDWLDLLIVPVVLAVGGYLFTRAENSRTEKLAGQRAQDQALQTYLEQISQLLADKDRPLHRAAPGDHLSTVTRAWTLSVLPQLDGRRKNRVIHFLRELGLIYKDSRIVDLSGADLRKALLSGAHLSNIDLSHCFLQDAHLRGAHLNGADLYRANLSDTDLRDAYLRGANLNGADMGLADLSGADLTNAQLSSAQLHGARLYEAKLSSAHLSSAVLGGANLYHATLSGADLRDTNLRDAYLRGADLSNADLYGAKGVTKGKLQHQGTILEGATMPDGQTLRSDKTPNGPTFDDRLKSKGGGEAEENGVPS